MTKLLPPRIDNLEQKIKYVEDCCRYLCSEFGLNCDLKKQDIQTFLWRLSRKTNLVSVGKNYIWNYLTYVIFKKTQIRRWSAFKTSWFFSVGSVNQWFEKNDDWYVYHGRWLSESKLKQPVTTDNISPRNTEEIYRKKYHNTIKGFVTCLENTSLYDPESRYCKLCYKKLDCREILKTNNPELYDARTK
jgi:hypothetical protein